MNTQTVLGILGALGPVVIALFGYLGRNSGTSITQTADNVEGGVTQRIGHDITISTTVTDQRVTIHDESPEPGKDSSSGEVLGGFLAIFVAAAILVAAAVMWWDVVALVLGGMSLLVLSAVAYQWAAHLRADRLMTAQAVSAVLAALGVLWALWEIPRGAGTIPSFADLPRAETLVDTAFGLGVPVIAIYVTRLGGLLLYLVVAGVGALGVVSRGILVGEARRAGPREWVLKRAGKVSARWSGTASWVAGLVVVLLIATALVHPLLPGLLADHMAAQTIP